MMHRLLFALMLLALLLSSSCTLWYAVNEDPDGLACSDDAPFCLTGYTCVDDGVSKVCRLAAALDIGQACRVDTECVDGAVCADIYGPDCGNDINCNIGISDGLRCRKSCNLTEPLVDQCSSGEVCWPDGLGAAGFCQAGVCTTDGDCGRNDLNNEQNLCFALINGPGSGLCSSACDPFQCGNPLESCGGCPIIDINGDGAPETWGCEPIEPLLLNRFGCVQAGTSPAYSTCNNQVFCQSGSFCTTLIDNAESGFCTQYCNVAGGAPACDQGTCQNIDGVVGFCQ